MTISHDLIDVLSHRVNGTPVLLTVISVVYLADRARVGPCNLEFVEEVAVPCLVCSTWSRDSVRDAHYINVWVGESSRELAVKDQKLYMRICHVDWCLHLVEFIHRLRSLSRLMKCREAVEPVLGI